MFDFKFILEGLLRWLHVLSGIAWIGHLYFFNWVNAHFAATLDAETKKKVVPELMPRALYFFRWGAAFTWVTGFLTMGLAYYMGSLLFEAGNSWGPLSLVAVLIVYFGFFIYDALVKSVLKNPKTLFWAGWLLTTLFIYLMRRAGFSYRGYAIHTGALFGTIMAMNVWMRIWPMQQKIIRAIKDGQKPEDAWVALAGGRSKHNTYMSAPLVFMMISKSATWAAQPYILSLLILVGFGLIFWMYNHSKTIKGF